MDRNDHPSRRTLAMLLSAILIVLLWIALVQFTAAFDIDFSVFEDGSFQIIGCIPWDICN